MNQLGKIFNGINIMMRRWADKSYPRSWIPSESNVSYNLVARKFTSLTRFCTLRIRIIMLKRYHSKLSEELYCYLTSPKVKCRYQLKQQEHPGVPWSHSIICHEYKFINNRAITPTGLQGLDTSRWNFWRYNKRKDNNLNSNEHILTITWAIFICSSSALVR